MAKFGQYNLKPNIINATKKLGFKEMTKIQEAVIPDSIKGKSIIGKSQTGSGKTHAFLIPIFNMIDIKLNEVQAVITAPTRELANQIYENAREFAKLANMEDLKITLVTGGGDKEKLIRNIDRGQPQIVVGTPGRIKDLFLDEGKLMVTTAKITVIDEADMIFDLGFLDDVASYSSRMRDGVQHLIYSATIPLGLKPFLKKNVKRAKSVEIDPEYITASNVEHVLIKTSHKKKPVVLANILKHIDPYMCIIFVNTRKEIEETYDRLQKDGHKVGQLHGGLQPRERKQMLKRANNLDFKYLVATDIAARGIDIDGVSHVISLDIPYDLSYYIHRSGRTGRGKYTGESYVMYDTNNEVLVNKLKNLGIKFENKKVTNDGIEIVKDRSSRANHGKIKEIDPEVAAIISQTKSRTKRKGIKPGYKKVRKDMIQKVKSQKRREMIRTDIKAQKKARAIKKQRELKEIDWK